MPRLVHTADVHLHPDAPERRAALEAVLERAEAIDADAVTIGGDLFEDEGAAERLRPELRTLFSDRTFPVVVIPGNHDRDAFAGDAFFGPAIRPATADPFEQFTIADGSVRLTCVPYTPTLSDDLLVALGNRDAFDGLDCLLVHCSLEAPSAAGGAGDAGAGEEAATRYAPVSRSELGALSFDVVLAGHYHGANRVELPAESGHAGTFVYPGTPASVTRAETGRRSIAIVDHDVADPTDAAEVADAAESAEVANAIDVAAAANAADPTDAAEVADAAEATDVADAGETVNAADATEAARPVRLEPLESFHYDDLEITVRPGEADDALATVREQVETWAERDAGGTAATSAGSAGTPAPTVEARITVEGFVDRDEAVFAESLAEAAGDVPFENRTRSVSQLLEHPIYREFDARLDAETAATAAEHHADPDRLAEAARERLLAAMADLAAEGELT